MNLSGRLGGANVMSDDMGIILFLILIIIIPFVSLVVNIISIFNRKLFRKKKLVRIYESIFSFILTVLGPIAMYGFFASLKEHIVPLYTTEMPLYHTPVAGAHVLSYVVFTYIGVVSFWVLRISRGKLPPILRLVSSTGLFTGIILCTILIVQLVKSIDIFTFWIIIFYLLNKIILYINEYRNVTNRFINIEKSNNRYYSNKFLNFLYVRMLNIKPNINPIIFVSIVPLVFVVQSILIIFGQQPDSIIKALTQTCDWTFSQYTPPPMMESDGHYLCTVAARGHRKLVRPIRYGIRHGGVILVNRQLLVANAFEDMLGQYVPSIHRIIRMLYDKFGIPIYKYINKTWLSDITYILMKPLELFFVICLYSVDINPENRINKQYLPK